MIGLAKMRKILGRGVKKFTDKQLKAIHDYLTRMAQYNVEIINKKNRKDEGNNTNVPG